MPLLRRNLRGHRGMLVLRNNVDIYKVHFRKLFIALYKIETLFLIVRCASISELSRDGSAAAANVNFRSGREMRWVGEGGI